MRTNKKSRKSAEKNKRVESKDFIPTKGTIAIFIDSDIKELKLIASNGIPFIFSNVNKFQLHIKKGNIISGREIEV